MARRRFKVYLMGPIAGCNRAQQTRWREQITKHWGDAFDIINPMEQPVPPERLSHEVIERDLRAIEEADGVLANMWRESIGTAIGIAHASARGRAVVVVDPNHIESRILAFYASAVVERVDDGMRVLRNLLKSEHSITVIRLGGVEEPFDRSKLLAALRAACRTARRSDIVGPPLVLQHVLEAILAEPKGLGGRITTRRIEDLVLETLRRLEADPALGDTLKGVGAAWQRFLDERRRSVTKALPAAGGTSSRRATEARPLRVGVRSGKSHSSIWGKTVKSLEDVPAPARRVFETITTVPGIQEIRLTKMLKGPGDGSLSAELIPSTTPHLIEGKLHDRAGTKGTVQAFQVRVHDEQERDEIGARIQMALEKAGLWRH